MNLSSSSLALTSENAVYEFDVVILLGASEATVLGGERIYHELEPDKQSPEDRIYVGSRVRMQAAVDIAGNVRIFVVVCGSKKKVDDIKAYLESGFSGKRLPKRPHVLRIESQPDTLGNLWALRKFLEEHRISLPSGKAGILTNFYHMPRTLRLASEVFPETVFRPIAAESVGPEPASGYREHSGPHELRIAREISGLNDWQNARYTRQEIRDVSEWQYTCHDPELIKELKK